MAERDWSVLVGPAYFVAMGVEHALLKRRAASVGPTAADYTKPDTVASLSMGVASLAVPITQLLVKRVVPRATKAGNVVLGAVAASAAIATVADRVATRAVSAVTRQRARRVAAAAGVATVAGGGVVLTASAAHLSSIERNWALRGRTRDLGTGVLPWTIALVGWDFAYYWNHRFMHEIRSMWAIHVPHHSSERYNLSTALRQPAASTFGVWFPLGLLSRIGVRPSLIAHSRAINLIYQFWIHTDTIRRLGPAEEVLNTPSHHRVHHGSNQRYLDRNHAGILIVWDRLFGTFQRELDEEPVVYGLTKNIDTFNTWTITTHEYRDMFADVADSTSWRDRLGFVLRSPGWAYRRRDELDHQRATVAEAAGVAAA